jgi:16S rRNA (guanine966-N2)-methyltransferase
LPRDSGAMTPRRHVPKLRVVAGTVGGRRLVAPPDVRPTAERVREALFSALGPGGVMDTSVLDLYAGSGALAIEALSRGAARAVLVDRDRGAVEACQTNLDQTGLAGRARVVGRAVEDFVVAEALTQQVPEAPFDLVLCDPPYDTTDAELAPVLVALAAPGWLSADALVVVERAARPEPMWPQGWDAQWERRYGDTLVTMLAAPNGPSDTAG